MKMNIFRKIVTLAQLPKAAAELRRDRQHLGAIVHCHGCFDIVHPGHLRYLQFARQQGDALVVSLTSDDAIEKSDGTRPYVPQELRAETLASLEFVDLVVIADGPTGEGVIRALRPEIYIKGKEYEGSDHPGFVAEKNLVESLGGRVMFSSGDVVFSSTAILDEMGGALAAEGFGDAYRLSASCGRWGIDLSFARRMIQEQFANKRVAVIGDAMLDRYASCDAVGVAGEAPMMSLKLLEETDYLGGAAIIAAHLKSLGAQPHLFTAVGPDEDSIQLLSRLDALGISYSALPVRRTLPVKQRFLVDTQKVLKVDRAEPQPLDSGSQRTLLSGLFEMRTSLDAAIFTDFGCGVMSSTLLAQAIPMIRPHVRTITGDISGPRRSMLAFKDADLLTPNERELRSVVGDFERSLPTLAMQLMKQLSLGNLAVTMAARGCVLFRPREDEKSQWFNSRLRSEYLPTLAEHAVDPLGAGDAFLSAATLALCSGASLPQAGYLGSVAAGIAVSRVGNKPVTTSELLTFLRRRPELQHQPPQSVAV